MSVRSVSFAVLRSSSVRRPSYCFYSFFCNTIYYTCLPPSEYLPSNSIKALKCSRLLIKSSICPCKLLLFFSTLHLYSFFRFSLEERVQSKFPKYQNTYLYGFLHEYRQEYIKTYLVLVLYRVANVFKIQNVAFFLEILVLLHLIL